MSTRENKPVPKNYITVGINKNLLTPCRRIGLSRSKKTPKNVNTNFPTPIPNAPVETPVKNVEHTDTNNKNLDFDETPKKLLTPRKVKKNIVRTAVETENIETNHVKIDLTPETKKMKLDKLSTVPKNVKTSTLKESLSLNVAEKIIVPVQVHHPVANKNITFNEMNEPPSPCPSVSTTKEHKSDINKNTSIFTPVAGKKSPNSYQIEELKKEPFVTVDIRNKKCRLRLDSNDITSIENQAKFENCPKTILTTKKTIIKKSSEDSKGIMLSRFTTEDYLKEYSADPEIFQENLEENGCIVPNSKDDMDAFCTFSNTVKFNPVKSKEKHNTKSPHLSKKNYVAILCPSIDQSVVDKKLKSSLFTKTSSLELKRLSEKLLTPSKLKRKLTISLEHITNEDLNKKKKTEDKDDIRLKELPSTPESISLTTHSKINSCDEDDELFTSSPENDKKQHENLLKLIINIENEIKQKEEKLEKLKQAQVYKNKHSPEKLKVSSDRWLEGCKAGLSDLLAKMQEHGSMDMDTLIQKLRIPDDIVEKLKL